VQTLAGMLKNDPQGRRDVATFTVDGTHAALATRCKAMHLSSHALQATPEPYRNWALISAAMLPDAKKAPPGSTATLPALA
jgi:hypothetical protein